ncbi:hypothetical protein QQ008_22295 [Fulvivirgaceae bacterium BMA10]|uniref:Lipoprotein n=1 Tax=Splendidivirga corallicola TaxID=3051826 RepID=A0ABT8KTQ5_9BACT|nr:hypothetical protein [Fulvivirgaceae bacterium BMA10]
MKSSYLTLILILTMLCSLGCKKESELIGTVHDVSCADGSAEIGGEVFDLRSVNDCGSGLVLYTRTVTSVSGNVSAKLQISCGAGFCMSGAKVLEWND